MADRDQIIISTRNLLATLPSHVTLVAAAKFHSPEEVLAAVEAGVQVVGENYVQEARRMVDVVGRRVRYHMIGKLQKNKVKHAVDLFDLIETVDSWGLAEVIDKRCAAVRHTLPVLVEINSGLEENKSGILPERAEDVVRRMRLLKHVRVQGLMTMGPLSENAEDYRPYFRIAKELFDHLASARIPGVEMRHLSMGMSDSYRVAIEEGATIIRVGTAIFGPRPPRN
jgi:pyridoxal phosphate enzyme (YggS family)